MSETSYDVQVPNRPPIEQAEQSSSPAEKQRQDDNEQQQVNVGSAERWTTAAIGGGLVLVGLSRRSMSGLALAALGGGLIYRAGSGHCPMYSALGISTARDNDQESAAPEDYFERGIHVEESFLIHRPAQELFQFWRELENLPKFMRHLEAVRKIDENRSRWTAKAPAGTTVEWDAEIINEEPNRLIAWRSLGNPSVDNAGSVRFVEAPGDRGTEVRVVLDYIPPLGSVGKIIAKLFGREPSQQIHEDLRRFKQLMETGEVPTVEGQPRGSCW